MTDWVPNTPNHPYYQKRNHVRLPKTAMSKTLIDNDAIAAAGGGGEPPVDPTVTIPFSLTVGSASNPGYSDFTANPFGSIAPEQIGSSYCTFFIESISAAEWLMKFGAAGTGYNGTSRFTDSPDGFDLLINGEVVPMVWTASDSDYRNPAPFPVDFAPNVGETYEFVLSYTPEDAE